MALRTDILHGYRHLHRALMQAVQFQAPWRFVARDQLREAFRERGASWSASGAQRTLWFLQAAAREKGIEHKVLKNLLRVRQERINEGKAWRLVLHESKKKRSRKDDQEAAMKHYEMTIAMLNKSMGICLR